jgi:transaldolase
MKFFVDTADVNEIREAMEMGLVDGVTTNPSLVAKTGRPFEDVIKDVLALVKGPVSLEVVSTDFAGMMREAEDLVTKGPQVVVKCPLTPDGLKATKALASRGTKVNVTLCFTATQALLAAKAGASYISPFIGRLDDISTNGMQVIEEIRTIYDNYGYATEILVASVRHPVHVLQAALIGADVATVPFAVIKQLFKHPLTDLGLEKFTADAKKIPKK